MTKLVHAVIKVIEKYIVHPLAITALAQSWVGHLQVIWQPWNDSILNTLEWQQVYMHIIGVSICMEASRLLIALTEYIMLCMGLLGGRPPQNNFFKSTICIEFGTISSVKLKLLTALLQYLTAHLEYMVALLEHIDLKSKEWQSWIGRGLFCPPPEMGGSKVD